MHRDVEMAVAGARWACGKRPPYPSAQWAALVRGHWVVESKTYWRRDALLAEERIRSRTPRIVTALSLIAEAT